MDLFTRLSALLMFASSTSFDVAISKARPVFISLVSVGFSPSGAAPLLILKPLEKGRFRPVSTYSAKTDVFCRPLWLYIGNVAKRSMTST